MGPIGHLSRLERLEINGTKLTDAGHLKGLPSLKRLDLFHSRVTDAGMRELQQALPNLRIGH
jgi:Leucine-rich repeat (LRR) protein